MDWEVLKYWAAYHLKMSPAEIDELPAEDVVKVYMVRLGEIKFWIDSIMGKSGKSFRVKHRPRVIRHGSRV